MDTTLANTATTGTTSSGSLSSVQTALQSTQSMMSDALAQQQQMNEMKMQFDGQMAQLTLQSAVEEKLTSRLEQMAQSIQN